VPQCPVLHIPKIELHAALIAGVATAAHLPEAGHARSRLVVVGDVPAVADDFRLDDWPRADQAHLAAQYIKKLRQLIEAGLAQQAADSGDARVVAQLLGLRPFSKRVGIAPQHIAQHLIGIGDHGAELEAAEAVAVGANTAMAEQGGPAIDAHQRSEHQEQRREQQQQDPRGDLVEHHLG
jgi:hypothetical protein